MSKLDNPPAFPTGVDDTEGMTLRDWFAGQALASGVSAEDFQCASGETRWQAEARYCYRLADAMLAERGEADRNCASYLAFLKEREAEGRDQ
ncbi:hypothetical protein ACFSTI_20850 [Rhizorhabdus histidinilytica]|uniref:Uncharacterized protein n=1 Tax=Rhizorhabdus histidinilytica TaxID=439228 RepID=A0A1T5BMU5_9SPHN|nr:hypothetical protein [Rhizorhabdus histidinilytica]SKB48586.1 hypothetical protein SAMN06295920_103138 [Rhizorhabdus histidinilytica]